MQEVGFNTMDLILSISAGLITVMLGIMGWILRQFWLSVKELSRTVDQLKVVMSVEQERLKNTKELVQANSAATEARVNSLELIVGQHDKDITVLKTLHDK